MPSSPPPEQRPVLSLADERERVIQQLSDHFANDRLSLEELETRIELAYKASSSADLQRLTADLPRIAAAPVPAPLPAEELAAMAPDRERLVSVMSETRRRGAWIVPQRLDLIALMSDTTIDLTQAALPTGIIDIHVRSICAAVKIVVPPGIQVVSRLSSLMSSVRGGGEPNVGGGEEWKTGTVVRLSGWVLMAEVQTTVRRRERTSEE
ncbi:MAG TPA: DUF1707 domain-containing protein [Gemmatimonadaceae bacterium]|jgi:hypothetical protein|nr:DUF1707 domain-containing protein [Gemmatimonadaceae bacterium]